MKKFETDTKCLCDKCNAEFELEIKEDKKECGAIITYFNCPICSKLYIAFVKNDKVFELEEELDTWKSRLQNPHMRKKAKKEIKKLQENIAKTMKQLKQVHEKNV